MNANDYSGPTAEREANTVERGFAPKPDHVHRELLVARNRCAGQRIRPRRGGAPLTQKCARRSEGGKLC
jgi:hypothetical protein